MNGTELGALRRLLMFSTAEAARWVAADDQRPHGVEERTWNRWETGKTPVPENIAKAVRWLLEWRDEELARLVDWVDHVARSRGDASLPVRLLWCTESGDFEGLPVLWRPQCSALSTVLLLARAKQTTAPVELVPFDAGDFNRWRLALGLPNDAETRLKWAGAWDRPPTPLRAKDQPAH